LPASISVILVICGKNPEYKANIRPVLLKWGAAEYIPTTQSYDSSFLSRGMEENIKLDSYTGSVRTI
jgi:hypothetical protein